MSSIKIYLKAAGLPVLAGLGALLLSSCGTLSERVSDKMSHANAKGEQTQSYRLMMGADALENFIPHVEYGEDAANIEFVTDASAPLGSLIKVDVAEANSMMDVGVGFILKEALLKGHSYKMVMLMRSAKGADVQAYVQPLTEESPLIMENQVLGNQWKKIILSFDTSKSYPEGSIGLAVALGNKRQSAEIAGVQFYDFGKVVRREMSKEKVTPKEKTKQKPKAKIASPLPGDPASPIAAKGRKPVAQPELNKVPLSVKVVDKAGTPLPGVSVAASQARNSFEWGGSVSRHYIASLENADAQRYTELLPRLFNAVSIENGLGWKQWEASGYMMSKEDTVNALTWLNEKGLRVTGGPLIWPAYDAGNPTDLAELDAAGLQKRIRGHLNDIVTELNPYISTWEVIRDPATSLDFENILSEKALVDWLKLVRNKAPQAALMVSQYGLFNEDPEVYNSFAAKIKSLIAQGAPIDVLGAEAFLKDPVPSAELIKSRLQGLGALGLKIKLSALNVGLEDEQAQAAAVEEIITAVTSVPEVHGVTMWGFWEGRNVRPEAALYRSDWSIKPSGERYLDLARSDFNTNIELKTDSEGLAAALANSGEYDITAQLGKARHKQQYLLSEDSKELSIVLDAPAEKVKKAAPEKIKVATASDTKGSLDQLKKIQAQKMQAAKAENLKSAKPEPAAQKETPAEKHSELKMLPGGKNLAAPQKAEMLNEERKLSPAPPEPAAKEVSGDAKKEQKTVVLRKTKEQPSVQVGTPKLKGDKITQAKAAELEARKAAAKAALLKKIEKKKASQAAVKAATPPVRPAPPAPPALPVVKTAVAPALPAASSRAVKTVATVKETPAEVKKIDAASGTKEKKVLSIEERREAAKAALLKRLEERSKAEAAKKAATAEKESGKTGKATVSVKEKIKSLSKKPAAEKPGAEKANTPSKVPAVTPETSEVASEKIIPDFEKRAAEARAALRKKAEEAQKIEEAKQAEAAKKTEEAKQAEAARKAEIIKKVEAAKKAQAAKQAEAAKKAVPASPPKSSLSFKERKAAAQAALTKKYNDEKLAAERKAATDEPKAIPVAPGPKKEVAEETSRSEVKNSLLERLKKSNEAHKAKEAAGLGAPMSKRSGSNEQPVVIKTEKSEPAPAREDEDHPASGLFRPVSRGPAGQTKAKTEEPAAAERKTEAAEIMALEEEKKRLEEEMQRIKALLERNADR